MKAWMHIALAVLLGGAQLVPAATGLPPRPEFTRYAPIIQRRPFGGVDFEKPVGPPGGKKPAQPELPPFTKVLRLCAITEDGDSYRVGFLDISKKPQTSYIVDVGETVNGITVVEADYEGERALLEKDGEQHWLARDIGAVATARAPSAGVPRPPGSPSKPSAPTKRISYAEKLRQRREALRKKQEAAAKTPRMSKEELATHLQEIQADAIRKGLPPLPVKLTPEMDDKLVKEGVLPPIEGD